MTTLSNHQVLLADRPIGLPKNSDWNIIETDTPELKTGEILVKKLLKGGPIALAKTKDLINKVKRSRFDEV